MAMAAYDVHNITLIPFQLIYNFYIIHTLKLHIKFKAPVIEKITLDPGFRIPVGFIRIRPSGKKSNSDPRCEKIRDPDPI